MYVYVPNAKVSRLAASTRICKNGMRKLRLTCVNTTLLTKPKDAN